MPLADHAMMISALAMTAAGAAPRVEVVVDRDPDNGTDVAVFVDGVRHDAHLYVIDPGRGYSRDDWGEQLGCAIASSSPAAGELITQLFTAHASSRYISE